MFVVICIDDLRSLAKKCVVKVIFDYVDCGVYFEVMLCVNCADLELIALR